MEASTLDTLQTTPLTAEQLEIVRQVYKDTKVLVVKDRDTMPSSQARPYGQSWNPRERSVTGGTFVSSATRKVRMVERMFAGSMVFPQGIPVGVTRIFKQNQPGDMGPDKDYKFVHAKYDVTYPEIKRVKAYCYGKMWMSDEERAADERRKSLLRAKRAEDELDPVTAQAQSVSDLIAESIAKALGKMAPAAAAPAAAPVVSDDPVVKMRWVEDEDAGKKRRAYFVETPDGEAIEGPFPKRKDAEAAMADLDG